MAEVHVPLNKPTLEDAAFLDMIAVGFEAVKIKTGLTASQMVNAQKNTKEFHVHAERLRVIAKKIRAVTTAALAP